MYKKFEIKEKSESLNGGRGADEWPVGRRRSRWMMTNCAIA